MCSAHMIGLLFRVVDPTQSGIPEISLESGTTKIDGSPSPLRGLLEENKPYMDQHWVGVQDEQITPVVYRGCLSLVSLQSRDTILSLETIASLQPH